MTQRRQPPDGQQAAGRLTKEGPDETASERFEERPGLPLSPHTAHEVPPAVGEGLTGLAVAPRREEIVATGRPWGPRLVLAMEGAEVPTRPETAQGRRPGRKQVQAQRARWTGEWREAKGVQVYRRADERIVQVLSWHQGQTMRRWPRPFGR
jgi:hypothetical protein